MLRVGGSGFGRWASFQRVLGWGQERERWEGLAEGVVGFG